jgi:hypothetical protein
VRDCACLAVNGVGKPGAGEPHTRFDRGRLRSGSHGEPPGCTYRKIGGIEATAFARGEYADAARRFDEIGSLPYAAHARLHGAEALVASGRRAEADAELGQALAFYRSVGASFYKRRAEEILAAAS